MFSNIKRHNKWTQKDYFAYPALSNSMLKDMQTDPMSLVEARVRRRSPEMTLGSAYDDFILSPHLFDKNWTVVTDGEAPTTPNQHAFVDAILGGWDPDEAVKIAYKKPMMTGAEMYEMFTPYIRLSTSDRVISRSTMNTIEEMAGNLHAHEEASRLVKESDHQVCFTGTHTETGVEVKGMIDMLTNTGDVLMEVDLKSTSLDWGRINRFWLADRGYDTQRAMYYGLSGAGATALMVSRTEGRKDTKLFDVFEYLQKAKNKLNSLIFEYHYRKENSAWDHGIGYYTNGGYEYL